MRAFVPLAALLVLGCAVDRSGTRRVDGGDRPRDAASMDASSADGGGDLVDAGSDAATEADAGAPDAGPPAPALTPLLVELPCGADIAGNPSGCHMTAGPPVAAILEGGGGLLYDVVLRVRAVAELQRYVGTSGGTGSWREGGTATLPSWTQMSLTIEDPATVFHLNHSDAVENRCFALDYTIPVSIRAGATVTLAATDGDGLGWRNLDGAGSPVSVAEPVPVAQPYDGQFVYVTLE